MGEKVNQLSYFISPDVESYSVLTNWIEDKTRLVDPAVVPSFSEFIGMPGQIELGRKYFELSRDMFYSRITEDKMNEEYLRGLLYEVRKVLQDAIQLKSIE